MKLQSYAVLLILVVALCWHLIPSQAADNTANAHNSDAAALQVVSYSSGLTGFFDPSSKTLYLYGSDLKTPFMTVQVETLGKPLKVVKAAPGQPQPLPAGK